MDFVRSKRVASSLFLLIGVLNDGCKRINKKKVKKKKLCMTVGGKGESTYSFNTLNGSKASFPADNNPRLSIFVNNFSFSWIMSVVVVFGIYSINVFIEIFI